MSAAEPSAAQVAQQKKDRWLEAFERKGTVTGACRSTGMPRRTVYDWRHADEGFALAWADIELATTEAMEQEAIRRGQHGVDKPVFQGGKEVGSIREFSDTLLIFMLKARKPDVYRERMNVQHSGDPTNPIRVKGAPDLSKLSRAQLRELDDLLGQADAASDD